MDSFQTSSSSAQVNDGASPTAWTAATTAAAPEGPPTPAGRPPEHPLIWLALLVWLSVEAIGEGLVALSSLLADATPTATASPSAATRAEALSTPQVTPS